MKRAIIAVAVLVGGAVSAWAEPGSIEDRLRSQLRDTVTQLRELQDSQANLQAQKMAAEQERDTLRAEVAKLRGQTEGGHASARERAAMQAEVAQARATAGQAADAVRQKDAERIRAEGALAQKTALYDACVAKNAELYRVGNEILDAYRDYSLGSAMTAREPFIGLHRVALENAVQGYGDRLYDGQFDPHSVQMPAPATAAVPAPAASPTATPQQQPSSSSDSSGQAPH